MTCSSSDDEQLDDLVEPDDDGRGQRTAADREGRPDRGDRGRLAGEDPADGEAGQGEVADHLAPAQRGTGRSEAAARFRPVLPYRPGHGEREPDQYPRREAETGGGG